MVAEPYVRAIRRDIDRLLIDTCTIKRRTGESLNTASGALTPTFTQQYSGKCRVRPMTGREVEAGEEQLALHMFEITVPYDTDGIEPDDVVTVTSQDGDLNGATLVVEDSAASTLAAFRKLICRRHLE